MSTTDFKEDMHTLGSLHHDCMIKAYQFETDTKSRGEELKALAAAKKIVIEATSRAQISFLQLTTGSELVSLETSSSSSQRP